MQATGKNPTQMDVTDVLQASPRRVQVESGGRATSYELADDLIASHGASRSSKAAVLSLEGGAISVERIDRSREVVDGVLGPVYRQVPGGGLAVPTGRVLVRFSEGATAAEHEADLAQTGFRLEEPLAYAPHAAWVRPARDEIVPALAELDRLAAVPGVEHVEPQLITESRTR